MESVKKFENMIMDWLKPIPHLPTSWRKWISENIWWISVIVVIFSVLGTLSALNTLFTVISLFGAASKVLYGPFVPAGYNGLQVIGYSLSLVSLAATAALTAMAVPKLQMMRKKGWDLLFMSFLVGSVSQIAGAVLTVNPSSIISHLVSAFVSIAISAYFLFEIRTYFAKK